MTPAGLPNSVLAMGAGATVPCVPRAAGIVICLRWIDPAPVNRGMAAILHTIERH